MAKISKTQRKKKKKRKRNELNKYEKEKIQRLNTNSKLKLMEKLLTPNISFITLAEDFN